MEDHVEHGEAGVLRGAGATLEAAHGEVPRLPLPAEVEFGTRAWICVFLLSSGDSATPAIIPELEPLG